MVRLASNLRSDRNSPNPEMYAVYSDRNRNRNECHGYTFVKVRGNERAITAFNKLVKRPYGPGTHNVSGWIFNYTGHYDAKFCQQLQMVHRNDNFFECQYVNKKLHVPTVEQYKRICSDDKYWARTGKIFDLLTKPAKLQRVNEKLKDGEVVNDSFWESDDDSDNE